MFRVVLLFSLLLQVSACTETSGSSSADPDGEKDVYYVSMSGSNSNGGQSPGDAWRTLQFAVDSVGPGDTVYVLSGTYAGCRIEQSGMPDQWITLSVFPGDQVLIDSPGADAVHASNIEVETSVDSGIVAYWIIEGFEISQAPTSGLDLRGISQSFTHHITVRNNHVHHNGLSSGKTGIFLAFVHDALIENNETNNNGEHGIYQSNSGDYPTIRGNICHHNANCGIHMNGDLSMGNDGIISNATVESNIIFGNGAGGGSAINMDGVSNSIVRNNLLYDNHAGGIAIYQQDGAVCSSNNRVLNNTIVMAADGRWCINIAQSNCINNKLFNNIIYTHHSWRGSIVLASSAIAGFESDYNVVLDRFSVDGGNTRITLSQWQGLGHDLHSLIATPDELFVNPASWDHHLTSGSPAIDQGLSLPDVPEDIEGNARPQGLAFDIGAYEHVPDQEMPAMENGALFFLLAGIGLLLRRQCSEA